MNNMKRITFVLLYALLTGAACAQTLFVRTQDKDGNVSPSEAISGPVGAYRFTIYPTDGGEAVDLTALKVRFIVTDMGDGKVIVSNAPALVGTNYGFRGEGTLSRVGSTNTVQFIAYPDGSDPYALYWSLLTVTSAPSAGAVNNFTGTVVTVNLLDIVARNVTATSGYFGDLTVGNLNVTNAISITDTTAVKLAGSTMTGPLTGTTIHASAFVGNGQRLTGLDYGAITNTPSIPSFDAVLTNEGHTINGLPVTNGAAIVVGGGGSLLLYTGLHGVAYFTNTLGYPEPLRDKSLPSHEWTTFIDFNGPEDIAAWSNLNVTGSAWQYYVTNGYLSIIGPNESSGGRFFGLIPTTTGVQSRFAMRILQPLQYSVWANGNYGYGIAAYDVGLTNTVFHGRRANTAGDVLETYIFNRAFSEAQDTRYLAPHTAGSLSTAYTYLWGYSDLILYGDFDGVSTLRFYTSNHGGERPALQYRATNCASVQAWAIFSQCSSAVSGGTNSSAFLIDWYGVLQSNLWTTAF